MGGQLHTPPLIPTMLSLLTSSRGIPIIIISACQIRVFAVLSPVRTVRARWWVICHQCN